MDFIAPITAFALTVWAVGVVIKRLTLDHPNDRSSHTVPTPRGGGLGVMPVILLAWVLFTDYRPWTLLIGSLALMLGSWIDDRRGLPALTRLLLQSVVVAVFTVTLPIEILPLLIVVWFALLWFVNLYNFMDGIDGITGVETVSLCVGITVICLISGTAPNLVIPALIIAAAGLGFLVWNWHPAKVFLGDSGSVPLGLLTGGLLIELAFAGQWQAALILPAYYLADATITLCSRLLNGEKIWQAHRKHFYQRATRGGAGPVRVSVIVLTGNLGLTLCACLTAWGHNFLGLSLAAANIFCVLTVLQRWGKDAPP